jgi:xylulose-5-phosphate/fructose-6-phosphate phosphoketolase
MVVLNDLDRFHLCLDVVERTPKLEPLRAYVRQKIEGKIIDHKRYIAAHGDDMPEIRDWVWPYQ